MKINLALKIFISLVLFTALAFTLYYISDRSTDNVNTGGPVAGHIQFELYDDQENRLINERLEYYQEDTLFSLLDRHYTLVCADKDYKPDETCSYRFINGRVILALNDVETDWTHSFLSIYINESMALRGISLIIPEDGDTISIRKTKVNG